MKFRAAKLFRPRNPEPQCVPVVSALQTKKAAGFFNRSRSLILEKKHPAPNRRWGWLEAEAGPQGDDTAGESAADRAEIGAADVIGDLVGVKV